MGTTTTTFALNKPTVGGDDNAWGTDLNANADKIDDLLDGTTAIKPNLTEGQWKVGGVAVTASAAELNVLDGIPATLTATELGYVDGVTSAIQTQLNNLNSNFTLLATIATTSGNTQTASGLNLTPYKLLFVDVDGVGDNSTTSGTFSISGIPIGVTTTTASARFYGAFTINLNNGIMTGIADAISGTSFGSSPDVAGGLSGITTASTSFSVSMATTTFVTGNVRLYGIR